MIKLGLLGALIILVAGGGLLLSALFSSERSDSFFFLPKSVRSRYQFGFALCVLAILLAGLLLQLNGGSVYF